MSPPRRAAKDRLLERIKKNGDCWIYTGAVGGDGYGVIGIGRGTSNRAHRVMYEVFVGPIPKGMLVCHRCDTPLCINPRHLFLGTPKDNTQDMISKGRGRAMSGETHPSAKLSDADVTAIKRLRKSGRTLSYIADRFGVSFQHISALTNGVCRAK